MNADTVVLVIFLACVPAVNLYPFFYLFRPWRTTRQGQALMIKALGNMILVDVGTATLLFGEGYPGRDAIRIVGFTLFACGVWYLLGSLIFSAGARNYPPWSWFRRRS